MNEMKDVAEETGDPLLNPNLLTYVKVIISIIRAKNAEESVPEVVNLLKELQRKDVSFWRNNEKEFGQSPYDPMRQLRRELKSSPLKDNDSVWFELKTVESLLKKDNHRR